jgi:hypothetical protein
MSSAHLSEMTQSQRNRLSFVDLRLWLIGEIRRQNLVARFGIQSPAATRNLSYSKELGPRNLDYETKGKVYVRGEWFRPVFDFSTERVLTLLSQFFGDGQPSLLRSLVTCEGSALTASLDLEMLSVLTRAIHKKTAVEISYRALSSGLTTRELVPFAFAENGLHWHVRGYERRSGALPGFRADPNRRRSFDRKNSEGTRSRVRYGKRCATDARACGDGRLFDAPLECGLHGRPQSQGRRVPFVVAEPASAVRRQQSRTCSRVRA